MTATVETFHVERGEFDPELGTSPSEVVVDWTGPAHVRPTPTGSRIVESAGDAVNLRTYDVWVMPDAVVPQPGSSMLSLRVSASADPSLVGRRLVVLDDPQDDWQTARHLVCQTQL